MTSILFIFIMVSSLFLVSNPVFKLAIIIITILFIAKEIYIIRFKRKAIKTLHSIYDIESKAKVSSIVNEVCYEYSKEGMENTKRCGIEIYGRDEKCSNF